MTTGDSVKYTYLASGQLPATTDAGTIYIDPVNKKIYVGNVEIVNALPTVTTADAGKVLQVDSNGNWVVASLNP